jgi:hypothetical protein
VLFYRSDLLRAAGYATPPATWAGWVDAMARLAKGDQRYAVLLPLTEWEPPVVLALQRGATLLRDGDRFGDFQSPAFRAAFDFYQGLFQQGLAPRGGAAQSANLYQDFADGYFSILISGPWNLGELARRLPRLADAWATAPLPSFDGAGPGVSLAGGASLAVVRTSTRQTRARRGSRSSPSPAAARVLGSPWRLPARPSAGAPAARGRPRTAPSGSSSHACRRREIRSGSHRAQITEHAEAVRGDVASTRRSPRSTATSTRSSRSGAGCSSGPPACGARRTGGPRRALRADAARRPSPGGSSSRPRSR